MMLKIYDDLKKNISSIYKTNIITLNKFVHHSLNYPEFTDVLIKYGCDTKKLKELLFTQITEKEPIVTGNEVSQRIVQNPSGMSSVIHERLDPKQVYQEEFINIFFKVSEEFELRKITKQAQMTGQIPQLSDISTASMIRAILHFSKKYENQYGHFKNFLEETNFNISKFVKDDDLGKSNSKNLIDEICTNLNKKAIEGKLQPVIGREVEVEQLTNILKKARKNNPVLVGKAGVGKTAIVEGLAQKIVSGDVPKALKNAVIYELRIMDVVKGTSFRGQFEQKMSDLLNEFREKEQNGSELPVLFIDELHTIMGAGGGGQGGLDFSNIIKPALARGELRTIGSTTTDEWYKFIKDNPALDRRFISVNVKEPSVEDTLKILQGSLNFYEKSHNVKYAQGTLERAIDLSQQFITDNALPDKAFDLVDYAGAMSAVKHKKEVLVEDIEYALARHKNIDLDAIMESRKDNLEPLAPKIKKVIFGQDQAVDRVCKTVEKAIAGLNALDKPYGAYLFTGPTGTGKTELAKQIAKAMKAYFYRLDMSEFKEGHTISKLIGSPAGYVGYDDGSSLAKVINENPRTVLLLDEIEKAHPDVLKLFLQVMDYGKLTDSKGREINFRNVLLIMTSNAGISMDGNKTIGISDSASESTINKADIEAIFSPEFRARLTGNGPVEFKSLTKEMLIQIVNKYISEIQEQRLNKLNVELKLSPEVEEHLAELGLSKKLGARPIKDAVENEIIDKLTDEVLFGKLKGLKTNKKVTVKLKQNKIILSF